MRLASAGLAVLFAVAAARVHAANEVSTQLSTAELYARFASPSPETRPMVRWWWNGSRVNETEILRQLDLLKAARIGGVEINTIGMPAVSRETRLEEYPEVPWRSEEWCQLVRVAAEGARARGMVTDLLVGSGWPLGGRFLPVEHQTQRLRVEKRLLHGPAVVELTHAQLVRHVPLQNAGRRDEVPPARTEVHFLRLLPVDAPEGAFDPGIDFLTTPADGRYRITVPAGAHELYLGLRDWGFTHVKLGAPGADGPVVDHYNAEAVRSYLDHMTEGLAPVLGGRLGNHLRALFVDSFELDFANWTDDLPTQFRARRGYDLAPYLPFVLEPDDAAASSPFQETVRQARFDFSQTLAELFHERFLGTFAEFCREQGVLSRVQAYGREAQPLAAGMLVDIPEGETWLWHDRASTARIRPESTYVNRYVSSAAHLTGKAIVSFEAMSNPVAPFRELPADLKAALDLSYLDGLNHPILHGFNYTPVAAGIPGWIRFGSYFQEHNPWWPFLPAISDYIARIGTVLRHSPAQIDVAVLPPRADEWGRFGRLYQPFPEVRHPWYLYDLPRALHHAGYGADFVSEEVLQQAEMGDGRVRYGPQAYRVVLLADVESIAAPTLEALLRFARAGGKVVVIGSAPRQQAGLAPQDAGEPDVAALSRELLELTEQVRAVAPPPFLDHARTNEQPPSHVPLGHGNAPFSHSFEVMVPWAQALLGDFGVAPAVAFAPATADVAQVHHRTADADLFFIANTSNERTVATTLRFDGIAGNLGRWDPETGARAPVIGRPAEGLGLILGPQESVLLVFDRSGETATGAPAPIPLDRALSGGRVVQELAGPWQLDLQPIGDGPAQNYRWDTLHDLGRHPETAAFGGVAHYVIRFEAETANARLLDLGAVHGTSEVTLNGQALGRRWYGEHHYATGDALKVGRNELRVTVRTHAGNWMREKRDDSAAQRWASWYPPVPAGLVGPVRLRE